jgi:hypothetical protein
MIGQTVSRYRIVEQHGQLPDRGNRARASELRTSGGRIANRKGLTVYARIFPSSITAVRSSNEERPVTCQTCKVAMKELKGHIYHKKRKWRCPKCKRVRMQVQKPR